jgi:glycerophosphoryl diester phosphodiesterase
VILVSGAEQEVFAFDQTRVTLRPVKPEREKDPPRVALFVNDTPASRAAIYPGKLYHFMVISAYGQTQCFVNGYADLPAPAHDLAAVKQDIATLVRHKVTTVAHRGVHKHAPENTRISYVMAVEAGTPIVEFDTALTKDGHIIGMHDKTVDRTTDGSGKVAELTLEQIRKLDAGSWKGRKFKGEPVPTIDDVADVVRGKSILMLDLKAEGQGKAIADWLERSKFPRAQVILAPWEDAEGIALRRYLPDVPMIRLTSRIPTDTISDAYFAGMKDKGFSGFSINWQNLSKEFIDTARKNSMKVYTWTLNNPIDIAGAVLNGVDSVITDDPAATMKLISELTSR